MPGQRPPPPSQPRPKVPTQGQPGPKVPPTSRARPKGPALGQHGPKGPPPGQPGPKVPPPCRLGPKVPPPSRLGPKVPPPRLDELQYVPPDNFPSLSVDDDMSQDESSRSDANSKDESLRSDANSQDESFRSDDNEDEGTDDEVSNGKAIDDRAEQRTYGVSPGRVVRKVPPLGRAGPKCPSNNWAEPKVPPLGQAAPDYPTSSWRGNSWLEPKVPPPCRYDQKGTISGIPHSNQHHPYASELNPCRQTLAAPSQDRCRSGKRVQGAERRQSRPVPGGLDDPSLIPPISGHIVLPISLDAVSNSLSFGLGERAIPPNTSLADYIAWYASRTRLGQQNTQLLPGDAQQTTSTQMTEVVVCLNIFNC